MNLNQLIELENRFQPFLLNGDYTFIGPENQNFFEAFMRRVNDLAPIIAMSRQLKHFMGNKEAVIQALSILPQGTELRIYVVYDRVKDAIIHNTIEGYSRENNITFTP